VNVSVLLCTVYQGVVLKICHTHSLSPQHFVLLHFSTDTFPTMSYTLSFSHKIILC